MRKKRKSRKIRIQRYGKPASMREFIGSLSSYMLVLMLAFPTFAAEEPAEKLAEGVEETATGWVEVPKEIYETSEEENIIEGVTVGTLQGAAEAVEQTAEGAVNAATFYIPDEEEEEEYGEEG
ncbi:MAG: exosortase system-associated protein, TIGR04073 family, partial [Candidatus Omnitrophica bacterium]|nr:exosortase system-associated protein, TIGR04073 family [Candidatus Omnitrophota bacterium]